MQRSQLITTFKVVRMPFYQLFSVLCRTCSDPFSVCRRCAKDYIAVSSL